MKMQSPLSYDALQDDALKSKFNQLRHAITSIGNNSSKKKIKSVIACIQRKVEEKPILSRIVQDDRSLLSVACINRAREPSWISIRLFFHPAIKFLILANPSALLWAFGDSSKVIHMIARHVSNYVLMPWIATNHQWVLDHEICLADPPVFNLIRLYRNGDVTTRCTSTIIQQFFEAYPQGLTQVNKKGSTPLHAILNNGFAKCNADLFKWIAEKRPSAMLETNNFGHTPLYPAFISLTNQLEEDSGEICKFLIEQCPESVRMMDNGSRLPIQKLLRHCQHQPVKEVVVCLLRAYPESFVLHELACHSLIRHLGDNLGEICKYLIEQCPESVRMMDNDSRLPIHLLLRHCQHRPVKEVVVYLLREYTESYNMASGRYRAPSSIPFIQRIKPLLDDERELKENVADLQQLSGVFKDAVGGTDNDLASSTSIVFNNWTKTITQDLEDRMEEISIRLQDECNVE